MAQLTVKRGDDEIQNKKKRRERKKKKKKIAFGILAFVITR